ncbi:hypothetical protein MTR_3g080700 [Medicago truncatula]|uniref:Uncharacterized protein n=1 Tax=Medicago truncatula TaxID=3880 RepID=G7J7C9_MEDTR|nr:hypothetical protein MTR_3g080700 [Medicago truncatula]
MDRKRNRKYFPKAKSQLNCDFAVSVQNAFYCLSLTSLSSKLGLGVNTKVVGMDVSFLMPLV